MVTYLAFTSLNSFFAGNEADHERHRLISLIYNLCARGYFILLDLLICKLKQILM